MSHSLIVSNVPVHLNNATLQKYLRSKGVEVHILAFPDEYHHINDDAKTKSLQLITETAESKVKAADIFQDSDCLQELDQLAQADEKNGGGSDYAIGSTGQVHGSDFKTPVMAEKEDSSAAAGKTQSARRISVTMI